MQRIRYQVRFTKAGLLRWISHRDLARLWERLLRRIGLQLSMSEGFNPKPRIGFPSALALGTESMDEIVELELTEELAPAELLERLTSDTVPGLRIVQVCRVPEGVGKAQLERSHYVLAMPEGAPLDQDGLAANIDQLLERGEIAFRRKDKTVTADLREQIAELAIRDGQLHLVLRSSRTASLRPIDVLAALELSDVLEAGGRLIRLRTELAEEIDPAHCAFAAATTAPASGPHSSVNPATQYI